MKYVKENWLVVVSFKTELLSEALIHRGYRERLPDLLPDLPDFKNRMNVANDIYIDLNETDIIQNYFYQNTTNKARAVYEIIEKESARLIQKAKVLALDSETVSNKQLADRIDEFFKFFSGTLGMIGVPTVIDLTIESKLKAVFEKEGYENTEEKIATLAIPGKELESTKERIALFDLANEITERKYELDDQEARYLIKKHFESYGWLHSTLFLGSLYNEQEITQELKDILDEQKKNNLAEQRDNLKFETEKLIATLSDEKDKDLARFFQEAVYYRTARLEWMNQACFFARPLLVKVANRLDLTFHDLIYMLPEEIVSSLEKGDINESIRADINLRRDGYAYISSNTEEYKLVTGKQLQLLKNDLRSHIELAENKVSGIAAYKGSATGIVVVVKDRDELAKVKKGNILVTRLTTPDFVMAINNSAAVVTDLGGVTSHAAVTCREIDIPCIVGTKIATQVLKDGDLVEVDADEGVVRIIKKAE